MFEALLVSGFVSILSFTEYILYKLKMKQSNHCELLFIEDPLKMDV